MKNKNNSERVLAFNLATEINEEQLKETTGGSAMLTRQGTYYYTNRHGVSDTDQDTEWD